MMKTLAVMVFLAVGLSARAQVPDVPPSYCLNGCSEIASVVSQNFFRWERPIAKTPGLYVGRCSYLGEGYRPEQKQHGVVMVDWHPVTGEPYFSVIFGFFYETNPFQDWTLPQARKEMNKDWLEIGRMRDVSSTTRVLVEYEGHPPFVYWLRQDEVSGRVASISYLGGAIDAYCDLERIDSE